MNEHILKKLGLPPGTNEEHALTRLEEVIELCWNLKIRRDVALMHIALEHGMQADDFVNYLETEDREINQRFAEFMTASINPHLQGWTR